MSWLSKVTGIHLGNIGAPIGALLGSVIPGVGTALGAGLGQAIGGVGSGQSVKEAALKGGAVYAGGKILGSAGGLSGAAGAIKGAIPLPSALSNAIAAAGSGAGDMLKKAGFSVSDLLKLGIGGAGAIAGIQGANAAGKKMNADTGKQNAIADELAAQGRAMNARGAPLADAAGAGLLARMQAGPRATPDFSRFTDTANPFSAKYAAPPSPMPAPMPVPAAPMVPPPQGVPSRLRRLIAGVPQPAY